MIKNFVFIAIKYIAPLFLVLIPIIVIHGFVFPWEVSKDVLSEFDDSIVFQMGFNYSSLNKSGVYTEEQSRDYLVINKKLDSKTISVYTNTDGEFEVNVDSGGLIKIIITIFILVYLTWYCWIKKHNKVLDTSSGNATN